MGALSLGLDLGTTRIKAAELRGDGTLSQPLAVAAPRPAGEGTVREVDADAYRRAAEELLERLPERSGGPPLGIASQRSSFVLWERSSGRPVTPLISWQDRRAAAWCDARRDAEERITALTGLPLSPHYAGPKLAFLLQRGPELRARMARGELLFGTLESYLIWHWSAGAAHETDLSMAARTLLVEPRRGAWSEELLELFGVPRDALPEIVTSHGRGTPLGKRTLAASIADQPSGLLAVLDPAQDGVLVNLGTGAFVLRPTGSHMRAVPGYLSGPLIASPGGGRSFALEGTVNGGGATADREADGPTPLPAIDPAPDAFCLPDENGIGAPFWRPELAFRLDEGPSRLAPAERRRVVLEGLVFRAATMLEELCAGTSPQRVLVSGGLANEPFVPAALAASLGRAVEVLEEEETTLTGAARLAAGLDACCATRARSVAVPERGAWLRDKLGRWRGWVRNALA